jgi:hypothetical protein
MQSRGTPDIEAVKRSIRAEAEYRAAEHPAQPRTMPSLADVKAAAELMAAKIGGKLQGGMKLNVTERAIATIARFALSVLSDVVILKESPAHDGELACDVPELGLQRGGTLTLMPDGWKPVVNQSPPQASPGMTAERLNLFETVFRGLKDENNQWMGRELLAEVLRLRAEIAAKTPSSA